MLAIGARHGRAGPQVAATDLADTVDVEVGVTQTHIDMLRNRRTDAGDQLPGKLAGRTVDRVVGVRHVLRHAGNARAGADKALQTIVGTEINQAVEHRIPHVGLARFVGGVGAVDGQTLVAVGAIAGFGFEPEHAEVIAEFDIEVGAGL